MFIKPLVKKPCLWRSGNVVPARKENAWAALFSELEHGNKKGTFQFRDFADESKLLPRILLMVLRNWTPWWRKPCVALRNGAMLCHCVGKGSMTKNRLIAVLWASVTHGSWQCYLNAIFMALAALSCSSWLLQPWLGGLWWSDLWMFRVDGYTFPHQQSRSV